MKYSTRLAAATLSLSLVAAQDCSSTLSASYPAPSLAEGWRATLIANELTDPRSLIFDSAGHLLVVEQGVGIKSLTLIGEAPCLSVSETRDVISNSSLNHGLELSPDSRTLYASGWEAVYAWDYDPEQQATTSDARRVVTIGGDGGHSTRTLLLSRQVENMLLVSWGSQGNIDPLATDSANGVSQIRAFDISDTSKVHDFKTEGTMLGWGLRNSVGIAENPATGGIFSVENNVDNLEREGEDVHQDNPAEELNFHGYLNGTEYENQGANFGYPSCFPAWDPESIPMNENIQVGTQFAIGDQNATVNDTYCMESTVPPTLAFAAHMAPLDMKFNTEATVAYVTFRGSWNREDPQGYKLSAIAFDNSTGMPTAASDSTDGYVDIMSNEDLSRCPDECFRPVGLAWDSERRLFMSSDATGEIYVVSRADNGPVDSAPPPSPTGGAPPSETSEGAAAHLSASSTSWSLGFVFLAVSYFL